MYDTSGWQTSLKWPPFKMAACCILEFRWCKGDNKIIVSFIFFIPRHTKRGGVLCHTFRSVCVSVPRPSALRFWTLTWVFYDRFSSSEHGLTQFHREPARLEIKSWDLALTNNHSLMKSSHSVPGISDHAMVATDLGIHPKSDTQNGGQATYVPGQTGNQWIQKLKNFQKVSF